MRRLINVLVAFAFSFFAINGLAENSAQDKRAAFCVGDMDNGERVEVLIIASGDSFSGKVFRNGQAEDKIGAVIELKHVEYNPATRPGATEYDFQSSADFTAETGMCFSLFVNVDNETKEIKGKQFFNLYSQVGEPHFGQIECAGIMTNN